jgi:hypothetical protein
VRQTGRARHSAMGIPPNGKRPGQSRVPHLVERWRVGCRAATAGAGACRGRAAIGELGPLTRRPCPPSHRRGRQPRPRPRCRSLPGMPPATAVPRGHRGTSAPDSARGSWALCDSEHHSTLYEPQNSCFRCPELSQSVWLLDLTFGTLLFIQLGPLIRATVVATVAVIGGAAPATRQTFISPSASGHQCTAA